MSGDRYAPRRRAGVLALGQLAQGTEREDDAGLCVLLLPQPLEEMPARERVDDLLRAPGVVAVDPARLSYGAFARLPDAVHAGIAAGQARRLRLPGVPRAVALFGGLQYPLARALLSEHPGAELWLAEPPEPVPPRASGRLRARVQELGDLAAQRAGLRFAWPDAGAELWERMERLGVESGRPG